MNLLKITFGGIFEEFCLPAYWEMIAIVEGSAASVSYVCG